MHLVHFETPPWFATVEENPTSESERADPGIITGRSDIGISASNDAIERIY